MKKIYIPAFIIGLTFLSAYSNQSGAAGLKVSPAGFIIHNVTPGKPYDVYKETGLRLTIYNDDEVDHTYILSTHRPSECGPWEKGYLEIPDKDWCRFEKSEITVKANGRGYGDIYLNIPDKDKYYNQRWVATLVIAGKPGPRGISLAVQVRAQIETKTRTGIKGKPYGSIAFKPANIRFDNVCLSDTRKARVVIYNNDDEIHTYKIRSLLQRKETKDRRYLTGSYRAMPDPGWIAAKKESFRIKPGSVSILPLMLKIPDKKEYYGKKWEELLLVEPDNGLAGFIRVQIETKNQDPARQ